MLDKVTPFPQSERGAKKVEELIAKMAFWFTFMRLIRQAFTMACLGTLVFILGRYLGVF